MATNPTRPHSYFRKENKDAIARAADNIVGRRPTDGGQVPFARLPPECNTRLRIIKISTGKWAIYLKRSERGLLYEGDNGECCKIQEAGVCRVRQVREPGDPKLWNQSKPSQASALRVPFGLTDRRVETVQVFPSCNQRLWTECEATSEEVRGRPWPKPG